MYNEIIAALEQAATDDSVITVVTGTHTQGCVSGPVSFQNKPLTGRRVK